MHVGLVVYGGLDETSGGYRYDRKLVAYLRRAGDDVTVIGLPWRSYLKHLTDGLSPAVRRRIDRPFDVLLQDQLCHPSLWRHNPRLDSPGAIVALVHLLRSPDPQYRLTPFYRAIERRYFASVDGAICTSKYTRDRVREVGTQSDSPNLRTAVAYPAGRAEGAALSLERIEERSAADPFRILFVGNLAPRKGVDTLLEALGRLEGDWEATIVGGGLDSQYGSALRDQACALGIESRVQFTGEVSNERLASAFEDAHILAVPSRYEGFGMVYLEAMEYGVVPVAGSVGGASEFVADGTNGYVVDPGDTTALADHLQGLQRDRSKLERLARGARSTADGHPDWEESMGRVRAFLAEVADQDASPEGSMAGSMESSTAGRSRTSSEVDGA